MTQLVPRTWTGRNPPGLPCWPPGHRWFLRQRPRRDALGRETSAPTESHSGVTAPNAPLVGGPDGGLGRQPRLTEHGKHSSLAIPLRCLLLPRYGEGDVDESRVRTGFPERTLKRNSLATTIPRWQRHQNRRLAHHTHPRAPGDGRCREKWTLRPTGRRLSENGTERCLVTVT